MFLVCLYAIQIAMFDAPPMRVFALRRSDDYRRRIVLCRRTLKVIKPAISTAES
jgi:hypothetical protein